MFSSKEARRFRTFSGEMVGCLSLPLTGNDRIRKSGANRITSARSRSAVRAWISRSHSPRISPASMARRTTASYFGDHRGGGGNSARTARGLVNFGRSTSIERGLPEKRSEFFNSPLIAAGAESRWTFRIDIIAACPRSSSIYIWKERIMRKAIFSGVYVVTSLAGASLDSPQWRQMGSK